MKKRGQVTIFVAIGIILLIVVSFIFLVRLRIAQESRIESTEKQISSKTSLIGYTEECFDIAMQDIIKNLYLNGGYLNLKDLISYEGFNASCLYCGNINKVLSRKEVEDLISLELEEGSLFKDCIKNYEPFENQGYLVTQGNKNAEILIEDHKLIAKLNFPVTLKKGDVVERINEVSKSYSEDLGIILDATREIVNRNVRGDQLEFGDYVKLFPELKLEGQYFLDDYELIRIYTDESKIFRFFMEDLLEGSNVPNACCILEDGCFDRKVCDNIKMTSCDELIECSVAQKEIQSGESCNFIFEEKEYFLDHGEEICIQDESNYGQHYLTYCANGELKSEALGAKRICEDGIKRKNNYELCSSCGEPIEYSDLIGFIAPENEDLCTKDACSSLGDCMYSEKAGNIDCYPKYRPGVDDCSLCGEGGDANSNICDLEECNKLGNCDAEIKKESNKAILELSEASFCYTVLDVVYNFDLDQNLIEQFCDIEEYKLYYLKDESKEYTCETGKNKISNLCEECNKDFKQCTPEKCNYLGLGCSSYFNNTFVLCKLNKTNQEISMGIDLSQYNWEMKGLNLKISTNVPTICKYSESLISEWEEMITIEDYQFKTDHNENIFLEIKPPLDTPWKKIIKFVCVDDKGNSANEEITIDIPAKIGDLNIIKLNEGMEIEVDGEVSSCKFMEITEEIIEGNLEIFEEAPNTEFDVCSYISTSGITRCTQEVPEDSYFLIQCWDMGGREGDVYSFVS